jgi:hypothetical protein
VLPTFFVSFGRIASENQSASRSIARTLACMPAFQEVFRRIAYQLQVSAFFFHAVYTYLETKSYKYVGSHMLCDCPQLRFGKHRLIFSSVKTLPLFKLFQMSLSKEMHCDDYRPELNYFTVMSTASTCCYYDCGSKIERDIEDIAAEYKLLQCSPLNEDVNFFYSIL